MRNASTLDDVQRLYSMFPLGRPGLALLMLRLALGVLLMDGVIASWAGGFSWLLAAACVVAVGICIGLGTPLVSALCIAIVVGASAISDGRFAVNHVCAALNAMALVLMGPGGYSIDARLFGRRRITLGSNTDR